MANASFAPADLDAARERVARLRACCAGLLDQIGRVIVGQDEALRLLIIAVASGGHTLMVGVPGLGKTLMVRALAGALGWRFGRIQFTPDLMPSDITGTDLLQTGNAQADRMVFQPGPVFANLLLADEINRTPPKTQAALLEAMQERCVTVGGRTHRIEAPFVVIATQNPIEQEGTYPLPEAQLDRFMLSIQLDYPQRDLERQIAARPCESEPTAEVQPLSGASEFAQLMAVVREAPVGDDVLDYAVDLVQASRPRTAGADDFIERYVSWGIGPRGAQHLVTTAKAAALLDGRPAPERRDIEAMALPVLRHRLVPTYQALADGVDASAIVNHLLRRSERGTRR